LGKHEPPNPAPGKRKLVPIRRSDPIPRRTSDTSASMMSQRLAISFMKDIRVARRLLATYLVNSALRLLITRMGLLVRTKGA